MKKIYILFLLLFISICVLALSFRVRNESLKISNDITTENVIIIDAGHGGFDGGAIGANGTIEKNINLYISKYVYEYLNSMGYETILTRNSDTSLEDECLNTIRQKKKSDIYNRLNLMKQYKNSIYISIHQNSYPQEKYNGMQVFYSPNNSDKSSVLAEEIQNVTVEFLQKENNRVIEMCPSSVFLIYNATTPAVLVECGFLSNYNEEKLLNDSVYQKQLALCISLGIINFING